MSVKGGKGMDNWKVSNFEEKIRRQLDCSPKIPFDIYLYREQQRIMLFAGKWGRYEITRYGNGKPTGGVSIYSLKIPNAKHSGGDWGTGLRFIRWFNFMKHNIKSKQDVMLEFSPQQERKIK
jgi:hypothetical protein